MKFKEVNAKELKTMRDEEGIIFQGCGGEVQEWVDGINKMLTDAGILEDGARLEDVTKFEYGGLTNLLFKFNEDDKIDMGKLAMWRIQTHSQFGGTWLSDYVPNKLGGFDALQEKIKPDCPLIGQNGNIYNLLGIATNTLKENGLKEQSKEMTERVFSSGSYNEALVIIGEYVNITSADEKLDGEQDFGMDMGM